MANYDASDEVANEAARDAQAQARRQAMYHAMARQAVRAGAAAASGGASEGAVQAGKAANSAKNAKDAANHAKNDGADKGQGDTAKATDAENKNDKDDKSSSFNAGDREPTVGLAASNDGAAGAGALNAAADEVSRDQAGQEANAKALKKGGKSLANAANPVKGLAAGDGSDGSDGGVAHLAKTGAKAASGKNGSDGKEGDGNDPNKQKKIDKVAGKESDASDDVKSLGKGLGKAGKAVGHAATSPAGMMVGGMMGINAAIRGIMALVKGIINGIKSFVSSIMAPAAAAWGAVTGFFSSAFGASATVANVLAAVISIVMVGGPLGYIGILAQEENMRHTDGIVDDCVSSVVSAAKQAQAGGVSTTQEKNAEQVASVLRTYGLNDTQIAGVLGNFQTESGIDASTVEGIYDEKYTIGTRKAAAQNDFGKYVKGELFPMYDRQGTHINKDFYTATDGVAYPGIGLGQWTGENARLLITKSSGGKWFDLGYQLAYMLANGSPATGGGFWEEYAKQSFSSPEDAASYFLIHFEGVRMAEADRRAHAKEWSEKMSAMTIDKSFGESIIAMSKDLGGKALESKVASAVSTCRTATKGANDTLYKAALSYAYDTWQEGNGNNGTELYQSLHKAIFPGDPYFMSCDRGVATAVRWSGSDDDYPAGDTTQQGQYLSTSPKWERVIDHYADSDYSKLKPGDIFVTKTNGHTFMFTGVEATMEMHPKAVEGSDNVSASFGERSPGISVMGDYAKQDTRPYDVYRLVKSDNSDKYTNLGTIDGVIDSNGGGVTSGASNLKPAGGYNPYPYGQCTWWAYDRRKQLGKYAPDHYGNAGTWAASARAEGKSVDNNPKKGDIIVFNPGQEGAHGYYGHVGIVESVSDGGNTITISESNVKGEGVISSRTFQGKARQFQYIH